MAEFLVGPLLSMVREKASSYLLDRYKVMEGMEEQREILQRMLPAILDVIQDAEEKRTGAISAWLKALKKVAYEAIDVFDEFNYEALRREAKKKGHHTMLGKGPVSGFPSRNTIVFRYRMGKKLQNIVHRINELVKEMNSFGLIHQQKTLKPHRQTDSIMVDSEKDIVRRSRDEEKNKIIKYLLQEANNNDLTVLPIVGMGGSGKTTFAQLIYNDPEITKKFQLQRWCCVSDVFDVISIANSICGNSEINREKALKNLQNEVSGKKYLIVLDDVWNRDADKWGKLTTCLKHGGKGSAVVTTTRDAVVATIMVMGGVEVYNLEKLGEVYVKEIIQSKALCLPNSDEHSEILRMIVRRCDGSPLAAKAFGSILSTRNTVQEWEDILAKSNICNEGEERIYPILRLSYDDLPSHMKQCFAFCAIFPKDYEVDMETLIELWLAHDFIPLQEDDHLITTPEYIFKDLVWRSFFQDVKKIAPWEYGGRRHMRYRTTCKIHDLMHDIAQSVMGKECISIINSSNLKDLSSEQPTYHILSSHYVNALPVDFIGKQSPSVRTLLIPNWSCQIPASHLSNFNSLRALELRQGENFSIRPRHLQHLRYLNMSSNDFIIELPKDICILYNLQTLDISHCTNLLSLPKDMKYMRSLRHLYTNGCSKLKSMPPDLGQLTSLQILTYFVVGASSGCSTLRELHNLNLRGELELCGLENVSLEHAKAANLANKEKLTHLCLEWGSECHIEEPDCYEKVLGALKPHCGLQMLRVVNYKSTHFPTWMTDFSVLQNLMELHLEGCTMCKQFPDFIHFKSLEVLHLIKLDELQNLSCEEAEYGKQYMFPGLKQLKLIDLGSFESWVATEGSQENKPTFPLLEEVEISNCPKLSRLPEAPMLKILKLKENKAKLSMSLLESRYMSSLSELTLDVLDTEAMLQLDEMLESSLSKMELSRCNFFFPSSPSQPIVRIWNWLGHLLVDLDISFCDMLIYWPEEEFLCLVSLKTLTIWDCHNLIGCRPTQVKEEATDRGRDQLLPHLTDLEIGSCGSLTELFVLPPSLTELSIQDCSSLDMIWGQGDVEKSPSAADNHLPSLESLHVSDCHKMVALESLPSSLQWLIIESCPELHSVSGHLQHLRSVYISCCNKLESLNCLGDLPSLEHLVLERCKGLASLPCGLESYYSSLSTITIKYCPSMNMKPLYKCLQPRLDSLGKTDLSCARDRDPEEGASLRHPKSWKYVFSRRQ